MELVLLDGGMGSIGSWDGSSWLAARLTCGSNKRARGIVQMNANRTK